MNPEVVWDDPDTWEAFQRIRSWIEDCIGGHDGFAVLTSHTRQGLAFGHTIGLHRQDLPELVVTGMTPDHAAICLNRLGQWCRARPDELLVPGQQWLIPDGPTWQWRAAPVSQAFCLALLKKLAWASPQWRPGSPGSVLQILWPDLHGRYPGEGFQWPDTQTLLADWAPTP